MTNNCRFQPVCVKQKGHFFTNEKAAETYFDAQTPGYCSLDGKVTSSKKEDCLKSKDHFFEKKAAAVLYCEMNKPGYCCINHKVSPMKKGECLKQKGTYLINQKSGDKYIRFFPD